MNYEILLQQLKQTKERVRDIYKKHNTNITFDIINVRHYDESLTSFENAIKTQIVVAVFRNDEFVEYLIETFTIDRGISRRFSETMGDGALRELEAITSYITHKNWKAEKYVFGLINMKLIKDWMKKP